MLLVSSRVVISTELSFCFGQLKDRVIGISFGEIEPRGKVVVARDARIELYERCRIRESAVVVFLVEIDVASAVIGECIPRIEADAWL